jgi:hypothetical protein
VCWLSARAPAMLRPSRSLNVPVPPRWNACMLSRWQVPAGAHRELARRDVLHRVRTAS